MIIRGTFYDWPNTGAGTAVAGLPAVTGAQTSVCGNDRWYAVREGTGMSHLNSGREIKCVNTGDNDYTVKNL